MSGVATAIVGGAVIGGVLSSSASRSAAQTEANAASNAAAASLQATRESNQLQWNMFQQGQVNQAPWLRSGNAALAGLTGGLGLGSEVYGAPTAPNGAPTAGPMSSMLNNPGTPKQSPLDWMRGQSSVGVGGQLTNTQPGAVSGPVSGGLSPAGASILGRAPMPSFNPDGTPTYMAGGPNGQDGNPGIVSAVGSTQSGTGQITPSGTPTSGVTNYGLTPDQMAAAAGTFAGPTGKGQFTQTFQPSDLALDPSYKFRLAQGQQQLDASAAARGMTGSGQNLKDIVNFGQGAASQEYQAAYDRFMNNQNTLYNRLAGLAGVGQTASTNMTNAGLTAGGNIGSNTMAGTAASNNFLTGGASATAAGTVGSANAINNSIQGGINNWMGYQYLNGRGRTPQVPTPVGDSAGPTAIPSNIG